MLLLLPVVAWARRVSEDLNNFCGYQQLVQLCVKRSLLTCTNHPLRPIYLAQLQLQLELH